MSCCGGNCGCGSGCKCNGSCSGCKMYPDLSFSEAATGSESFIVGVAPPKAYFEGAEMGVGAEQENGCKCGDNCACAPCKCGKN